MDKARIVVLISEVLGIEVSLLSSDSGLGVTPGWDSLAHLEILTKLEAETGKKVSVEDSIFAESLEDLCDLFND